VAAYLSAFLDMPMCFLTREWARIIAGFTRICEEPFFMRKYKRKKNKGGVESQGLSREQYITI
ncbi:hypothetical protein, partial [Acinetobacter baumannii]|uniref:hypothetical protein n=1 Tax=Acinetobacter baumannii TaxID=470 RepID=UPI00313D559F